MLIIPDMLVLARESRGLTQSDVAAKVGVSQGLLSKFETGLMPVGEEHVQALANVLGYDPAFFSWKAEQSEGSFVFHRKKKSLGAHEYRQIRANFNIVRMQVEKLLRGVEIETAMDAKFPPMPAEDYDGGIEEVAERIRRAWKQPNGPVGSVTSVIEKAGGIVLRFPFGTDKCDGLSQIVSGGPPLFLISNAIPGDRYRYTLAHELGHVLMHQTADGDEDVERAANDFAGAFLLPAKEFSESVHPFSLRKLVGIKPYWKVSIQAMVKRAFALEIINERQQTSAFVQISRAGYRLDEPVKLPVEEPTVPKEIVKVYQTTLGYSESDVAKMVGLRLREEMIQRFVTGEHRFKIIT